MDAINFNFSCNNVKGLQKSKNYLQLLFQKKKKKSEWYFILRRHALHKRERNYVERLI